MFIAFTIICGASEPISVLGWGASFLGVNVPPLSLVSGCVPNSVLIVEAAPNTPSGWSVGGSGGSEFSMIVVEASPSTCPGGWRPPQTRPRNGCHTTAHGVTTRHHRRSGGSLDPT